MKRLSLLTFPRSSKLLHIAVVFLLAVTLRVVFLYEIHDNPFFHHLMLDESAYDQWAQRIAGGEWLGKEVFYQDPLYPYFLATIYSVIGRDFLWVRVIQLFIGSVTCVLVYLLGASLFDRRTGLVAGIIAASYRPFFYFEALFLKSFLGVFLLCLSLLLLLVARPRRSLLLWVGAGFALGLLALVRANTLVFAGGVVAWILVTDWETEKLKHKLVAAAGLMAGLLIVVSTVCARNYVVGKDVVLLTSQAGQNFFIGNNPWNENGRYQPPLYIRPNPRYEQLDFRVRAEKVTGRTLRPSEASMYWFGEAFRYIRENPGDWFKLMWTKFRVFWNWYEIPDNQNFYFFSQYSLLLRLPLPNFLFVAALGLCGMVLCLPQWRKVLLLYLAVVLYSGTVIAFYVFGRYRLPVVPPLIVFAAFVLSMAPAMIAQRRYMKLGATALVTCGFLVFLCIRGNPAAHFTDAANAYVRLGTVYQAEKKLDDALSAFKQASKIMPFYWGAYYGSAEIYESKGESDLALFNYALAKLYNPGNPDIYLRMGYIYYRKGQLEESAEEYRKALLLTPNSTELHRWLATIYRMQGDRERAGVHLRKLQELGM